MKLNKRIKLGAGIPVVIFLVFAVVFYLQSWRIKHFLEQLIEVEAPRNEAASRMEINVIGIGFEMLEYLQDHNPERIERIQGYKNHFREQQSIYCRLAVTSNAELSADLIDRNIALFGKTVEELINLEGYQVRKLAYVRDNFDKLDELLMEGFKAHSEPEEHADCKKLGIVMEMRSMADEIRRNLSAYLANHQEKYKRKIFESHKELGILAEVYEEMHVVAKHEKWFGRFDDIYADNLITVKDIVTLDKNKRSRLDEFVKAREKLRSILGSNLETTHLNYQDAQINCYEAVRTSSIVILILVLFGLIITLIFQAYISYTVTLEITELRNAADRISRGQYDTRIEIKSDDEIGQIARSINKMADELKGKPVPSDLTSREAAEPEKAGVSS